MSSQITQYRQRTARCKRECSRALLCCAIDPHAHCSSNVSRGQTLSCASFLPRHTRRLSVGSSLPGCYRRYSSEYCFYGNQLSASSSGGFIKRNYGIDVNYRRLYRPDWQLNYGTCDEQRHWKYIEGDYNGTMCDCALDLQYHLGRNTLSTCPIYTRLLCLVRRHLGDGCKWTSNYWNSYQNPV